MRAANGTMEGTENRQGGHGEACNFIGGVLPGRERRSPSSANQFTQYREVVLWAKAHCGPVKAVLSHETALVVYGVSDANPASIQLTVPRTARLRRERPKAVDLHYADLAPDEITIVEGLPVTTIARTIADLLESGGRVDLVRQAITGARKEGFISDAEARRLRGRVQRHLNGLRASSPCVPDIDKDITSWRD